MNALPPLLPARTIPLDHPGRAFVTGRTPSFACRADQRFSYALQVPSRYRDDGPPLPLLVVVHGTRRRTDASLDALTGFAEERGWAVLTPLFPAGIGDPDDLHNYKFIEYAGIRFDLVLLAILDDVAARWNIDVSHFALHGFSGGGQFAHRFLFLHPQRLSAVSIGAPGRVTLPDPSVGWWRGVGDLPARFGVDWAPGLVAGVPVQLVIGADDDGAAQLAVVEPDGNGSTRQERLHALAEALRALGSRPHLDLVPGVAHEGLKVLPAVRAFLDRVARPD
ncbi:esterase/PHB depolymerase [Actinocorallia herbida]|uniref:Esterase/PHB depolymerase n=1 Tax=Actinocorallia herbida TaxID=58109 RepID=A0A3N1CZP0_9ACTN|nr:alpha/beta hydrolase [Actinocorallia herbida]ROO86741.1 esterase/PHB depolymerase [Actinocorallia herbida]